MHVCTYTYIYINERKLIHTYISTDLWSDLTTNINLCVYVRMYVCMYVCVSKIKYSSEIFTHE